MKIIIYSKKKYVSCFVETYFMRFLKYHESIKRLYLKQFLKRSTYYGTRENNICINIYSFCFPLCKEINNKNIPGVLDSNVLFKFTYCMRGFWSLIILWQFSTSSVSQKGRILIALNNVYIPYVFVPLNNSHKTKQCFCFVDSFLNDD